MELYCIMSKFRKLSFVEKSQAVKLNVDEQKKSWALIKSGFTAQNPSLALYKKSIFNLK